MTITVKERGQTGIPEEDSFGGCTPRIKKARQRVRDTMASICLEKAIAMTEVFTNTEGEPMVLRKAKTFRTLCERKTLFIQDDELIVGQPSSKIRAGTFSPEVNYWVLSNELDTISTRDLDPFIINEEQKKLFKETIH